MGRRKEGRRDRRMERGKERQEWKKGRENERREGETQEWKKRWKSG